MFEEVPKKRIQYMAILSFNIIYFSVFKYIFFKIAINYRETKDQAP